MKIRTTYKKEIKKEMATLRTPNGKSSVAGDIQPRGTYPGQGATNKFLGLDKEYDPVDAHSVADYFLRPFNRPTENPGLLSTIWVGLLTYILSMFYGLFVFIALWLALGAGTDLFITAIAISILKLLMFVGASNWVYEQYLPTYIFPEIALSSVLPGRIGLIPALGSAAFSILGYVTAAFILININSYSNLVNDGITNAPTGTTGYILWFFALALIVFAWIYNREFDFRGKKEKSKKLHHRASVQSAIVLAVANLGMFIAPLNLRAYSVGEYVTTVIFRGTATVGSSWVNQPAWYVCLGLLVVPVAVYGLYVLAYFLSAWRSPWDGNRAKKYESVPETEAAGKNISSSALTERLMMKK